MMWSMRRNTCKIPIHSGNLMNHKRNVLLGLHFQSSGVLNENRHLVDCR